MVLPPHFLLQNSEKEIAERFVDDSHSIKRVGNVNLQRFGNAQAGSCKEQKGKSPQLPFLPVFP
jgi:hypothetical protein